MITIGINPVHSATVAIVDEQSVLAVVAEERLSRVKNHFGFPRQALGRCIELAGINAEDVAHVCVSYRELKKTLPFLNDAIFRRGDDFLDVYNHLPVGLRFRQFWELGLGLRKDAGQTYLALLREHGIHANLHFIDHHRAHANSVYYTQSDHHGLVVVADGHGDGASVSLFAPDGESRLQLLHQVPAACSPGEFYSAVTKHLGFRQQRHEGKVMGLAAKGEPERTYDILAPCLFFDRGTLLSEMQRPGIAATGLALLANIVTGNWVSGTLSTAYLQYFREVLGEYSREDIAAGAQKVLEDALTAYVRWHRKGRPEKNLLLSGGVFANVCLNQRIAEMEDVSTVRVHPDMGDGGTALGAALEPLAAAAPSARMAFPHVYLGTEYPESLIEACLDKHGIPYAKGENVAREVARRLDAGELVGIFQGRMEYGPRALGARSILCTATGPDRADLLNRRLSRSEFMPFAPVVLERNAPQLFHLRESIRDCLYRMTMTVACTPKMQAEYPAAVHVDGTARPQLMPEACRHMLVFQVLEAYEALTGRICLINTSFNLHEEPIVESPAGAVAVLAAGAIDSLAFNTTILSVKN